MNLTQTTSRKRNAAFSLAEMLVVISVIAFLLAMAAPNLFSLMRASELSTQGQELMGQLSLAQQTALSTNRDVEVRIFDFADANEVQTQSKYRALQFYQYDETGKLVPTSEIYRLKDPIVISEDLSNLIEAGESYTLNDPERTFGKGVTTASYRKFRFRPDGSTDLPKTTTDGTVWYMTLIEEQLGNQNTGSVPRNFYCVQIDPYNGSLREYRP